MRDRSSRKKGSGLKKCLVLAGILASFCLHAGSEMKGKFVLGAQTGWSLGLGREFDWHYFGATSLDYVAKYHVGGFLRYNLSGRLGFQFSLDYQHGSNPRVFYPWSGGKEESSERFSYVSYSLNGVCDFAKLGRIRLYLLAGAGLANGNNMLHFDDSFVVFNGGAGAKFHLNRSASAAIFLGAAFQHLWNPSVEHADHHADLIRLVAGLEFIPNK